MLLFKKLLRTAWKYKAQFISMIIMVALGIGVFVGFNMEWNSIYYNTDKYFEETKLADYKIYCGDATGFSSDDVSKIQSISGVDAASRVLSVDMAVSGEGSLDGDTLALCVVEDYGSVSSFILRSGKAYPSAESSADESADGIWLAESYAEANGIKFGDTLTLTYKTFKVQSEVKGLIMAGEYMICVSGDSQLMPDYSRYGYCFTTPYVIKKTMGAEYYTQINVLSSLSEATFEDKVNTALGKTMMITGLDENISYSGSRSEAEEGQTMGSILPVLFLLIGVLTMLTTMHRITANEKTQIGTLKALGFKDRRILWHYTAYGLFIGVVGAVLGIGLGYGIAALVIADGGMMSTYFDIPYHSLVLYWYFWLIVVAIVGLLTFISYLSVRKMLKGTAADALRPYVPKKVKKTVLEKTKVWNKLSFGTKWNTRDLLRHKSRSLMTLIGVVGCMVLIVGGMGMRDTMNLFLSDLNTTNNYETKINLSEEITYDYALTLSEKYNGDWVSSSGVKLDDKTVVMEIYELSNDKIRFTDSRDNVVKLSDDGVYVCTRIADSGYTVGSTITVSPYGSDVTYNLKVAGVIRSVSEGFVMTVGYAQTANIEDYTISAIYTDVKTSEIAEDSMITSTQSQSAVMESYESFMDIMNMMIVLLVVAAIVLGVVVLYNLGVMSYMERYREMATLKVVGFRNKHIGRLLIGQNIFLTILGIIIGLPSGYGVLYLLVKLLASEYELKATIGALTYIVSILLTFGVSLLVGLLVARKNRKINMVEALKGAE